MYIYRERYKRNHPNYFYKLIKNKNKIPVDTMKQGRKIITLH